MIKHFNVNVTEKKTNYLSKEAYMNLKFKENVEEDYVESRIKRISYNYDLNMKFFRSLDWKDFNEKLIDLCNKYNFKEVNNLWNYNNKSGMYIMVLDKYCQAYIGISNSGIKKRIQSHWHKKKDQSRLIFGHVFDSVLSIDSFGPLDTTRIFVKDDKDSYGLFLEEEKIVNDLDKKYLLNRIAGGIGDSTTYTDDLFSVSIAAIASRRDRDFTPFIDERELEEVATDWEWEIYTEQKRQKRKNKA